MHLRMSRLLLKISSHVALTCCFLKRCSHLRYQVVSYLLFRVSLDMPHWCNPKSLSHENMPKHLWLTSVDLHTSCVHAGMTGRALITVILLAHPPVLADGMTKIQNPLPTMTSTLSYHHSSTIF
jgi:hypothetical protein